MSNDKILIDRALVERAVESIYAEFGDCALLRGLNAALAASPAAPDDEIKHIADLERTIEDVKRTCEWTEQDPDYASDTWSSECGETWYFIDGGIKDNRVNFCHGCGGKIVEIKWKETL